VLTASHPCLTVELTLRRKGLEYRRAELPLILSRGILRAMRLPRRSVPALRVGDRRVQGSRAIARALEQLRPDPPLFPRDPIARERLEEAERCGEPLQDAARRIEVWGLGRARSGVQGPTARLDAADPAAPRRPPGPPGTVALPPHHRRDGRCRVASPADASVRRPSDPTLEPRPSGRLRQRRASGSRTWISSRAIVLVRRFAVIRP
jgi:hypothetical protein